MSTKISRRDFLKLTSLAGGGLILAISLEGCASGETTTPTIVSVSATPEATNTPRTPFDWDADIYIRLDQDGMLTFTSFRAEMGQGVRTAFAMLVAEELDIEWSSVRIVQADADSRYGNQLTGGSQSISSYYTTLRGAGASVREMIVTAGAKVWGVDPAQCKTEQGFVIHPNGTQKLAYADLVQSASKLDRPTRPKLKDPSEFRIIGKGLGHWDAPHILTGKAQFGLDVRLPDMLYAAIARCPVLGGKFTSYDDTASRVRV